MKIICTIEGCERAAITRGFCTKHYQRWKNHGDPLHVVDRSRGNCTIEGCERKHEGKGLCRLHNARRRRYGDPLYVGLRCGEQHQSWRGDLVGYQAVHLRLKALRGKASDQFCGCGQRATDWAYDHSDPGEKTELKYGFYMPYSTDLDHYRPMCRSCHVGFDRDHKREQSA